MAMDTNLTWRWSGTAYVEISKSLALGETASTAYAGDRGKALADDLAATKTTVAANTSARHSHTNKAILDKLTDAMFNAWNNAIHTMRIGSVTSGGTASASITQSGSEGVLNLVLPKGDKGEKGDKGDPGQDGRDGATGATGPQGPQGATGSTGPAGPNLVSKSTQVSGFSTGQVLYVNGSVVGAKTLTPAVIGAATAAQGGKADTAVQSVNGKKGTALTLSAEDVGAVPVSNRKVLANGIAWKSGSILTPDGWDDYSMIRISTNFGSAFIPKLAVNESSGNILVASALPNNYMNFAGFSIARNSTGGSLSIDVSPYALRLAPSGVTALSTELSVYKIEGFA